MKVLYDLNLRPKKITWQQDEFNSYEEFKAKFQQAINSIRPQMRILDPYTGRIITEYLD